MLRMIDVFEEVTVDPLIDGSYDPFGIDEQDGDSRIPRRWSGTQRELARHDDGHRGGGRDRTHEKVASIHPRFPFWVPVYI